MIDVRRYLRGDSPKMKSFGSFLFILEFCLRHLDISLALDIFGPILDDRLKEKILKP